MVLRPAAPADIASLNAIAFAAKSHWGYPQSALEQWRAELEVDPESLARPTCVAELDGRIAGFVQVDPGAEPCDLAMLWVDPAAMGKGAGRELLAWACDQARRAGRKTLAIDADPNAEAFYLRQGARRVGEVAAPIEGQPERVRPQLVMPL